MNDRFSENSFAAQAVDRILGTNDAKLVARLSDGPTNTSYRVEQGKDQYVLRLDKPEAARLGLDRQNEKLVSRAVAAAGLAPDPISFDTAKGVFLRRFVPGRCWLGADLETPSNLERLSRLLRKLHGLAPVGEVFDPLAAARRYARQLGTSYSAEVLARAEKLMREILQQLPRQVLCHNDLVCRNLLEGERLLLIDWEYAGIGDPYFDLAVVVQHHGLDPALKRIFLDAYLGQPAAEWDIRQLDLQCEFYACLLELWEQRVAVN